MHVGRDNLVYAGGATVLYRKVFIFSEKGGDFLLSNGGTAS